jgi:hypothetical protein
MGGPNVFLRRVPVVLTMPATPLFPHPSVPIRARDRGFCVRQLHDCIHNPWPHDCASLIASHRKLFGWSGAFRAGLVACRLNHQVRRAPDVDLLYHAEKTSRLGSTAG